MGRLGITYDQVAAAADALAANGGSATLKAVRDKLGTGGMSTIHKHLATWQANRPKQVAPVVELPGAITRELNAWVIQAATAARAESEESALQAQAAAAELARAGEVLEAERDELQQQIAELTTERDKAQATAAAHAAEIERLAKEVERERDVAGKAQIEAAQAKNRVESQTQLISELKETASKLNTTVASETDRRIKAEKDAAVLLAERDAARKEAEEERTRIAGLQRHLDTAHDKAEKMQAEYEKRLGAERTAAEKSGAEAKASAVESANLKARLEAAEATIARLEKAKEVDSKKG
jgi:colicin import membrane protein